MTAAIPDSHQGENRRSGRFSQRDESAVRDSAHMPSGRTFLANHAATRASASGSPSTRLAHSGLASGSR
jgi:hypothetical protein